MNSIRVRVKQTLGERFRPSRSSIIVRVIFNRIDSVVHSAVFHSLCCSFLVLPSCRVICATIERDPQSEVPLLIVFVFHAFPAICWKTTVFQLLIFLST